MLLGNGRGIDNTDWPLERAIGKRNDKRASSGCGENYVTETGPTYTFSPGHPYPTRLGGGLVNL